MWLVSRLSQVWASLVALLLSYSVWSSLYYFPQVWQAWLTQGLSYTIAVNSIQVLLLLSVYSVVAALINVSLREFGAHYQKKTVLKQLLALSRAFKVIIALMIAHQGLPMFGIPAEWQYIIYQCINVVSAGTLGWCVLEAMQLGEAMLLQYYLPSRARDSIEVRRIYTQVAVVKRILVLLLGVVTVAMMLMNFEKIRAAGTTLLKSAGVLSTIVLFSARGLLESLFKGLQLIIAQPVRLEDTVTINGEVGTVTSITLHHVVITLSDRSQLIVPTGDLLDKTFKNWTHSTDDLIGNILFHVKYNAPIELIRTKFHALLKANELWDESVGEARVTDLKSNLIELKLIMSAKTGRSLAKLRNEILEQLLDYMQTHHPESLP